MLNAPDYTRTCSCSYPNQTSLALIHMPDVEQWVTYFGATGEGAIRDVGINLGAPGNRRAPDGRFWMAYPLLPHIADPESQSGITVDVEVTAPDKAFYTQHASSTSGDLNWVAASGCRGIERVQVPLNTGQEAICRVGLVFAEPDFSEPGRRLFDLHIEGKTVRRDVDIYAQTGAVNRALVMTFEDIVVTDGTLTVDLRPASRSADGAATILSGVWVSVAD